MSKSIPFSPNTFIAAYFRDSGGEEQELSVPRQEAEFRRWCTDNGLIPGAIFKDEGRPGSSVVGRAGFQDMMRHFRSGQAPEAGLVVWNYQRFARDIDDSQFFRADLRRRGYVVYSLNDEIPEGPMGRLFEAVLDWKNEQFLIDLSTDVKSGLRELVERYGAVPGFPPRGFKREPIEISARRDGRPHIVHRWVPDPDMISKVRLAFNMLLAGNSLKEIQQATKLYRAVNSFTTFFRNPLYKGILNFGDLVIVNYCDPVVDPMIWDQAQVIIRKRAGRQHMKGNNPNHPRRQNSHYILSGLAYCARCMAPLYGASAQQPGKKRYNRYVCGRSKRNHDCDAETIPGVFLEDLVIKTVGEYILNPENFLACQEILINSAETRLADLEIQRGDLRTRLGIVRRQISNITDSLAEAGRSRSLIGRLSDLEEEEADLLANLNRLSEQQTATRIAPLTETEIAEQIDQISRDLHNDDPVVVKRTLRGIVSRIIVERDGGVVRIMVEYYYPPRDERSPPDGSVRIIPTSLGVLSIKNPDTCGRDLLIQTIRILLWEMLN